MVTLTGLHRNSEASFWIEEGHVAENMRVCLSARVCCAMALHTDGHNHSMFCFCLTKWMTNFGKYMASKQQYD